MAKINTVLGAIEDNFLGETLFHEHVFCANTSFCNAFGNSWLPIEQVVERAIKLFKQAKEECGVQTIVDATPIDLGRKVEIIKEVSLKSGVNILVSSGIYDNEEAFLHGKRPEKLAKFFIEECQKGIADTDIRPAILKCATGKKGITEINELLLTTMAITQKETGLPLYCHNEHDLKTPYQQLKIFEQKAVNLEKVIIGHCSDTCDLGYLEALAKNGCYLAFDRIYPFRYQEQAKTIAKMIEIGYEDKILLSHDYFAYCDIGNNDFEEQKNSNRDFTTVHKKLLPELEKLGANAKQLKKFTIDNPKKVLIGEKNEVKK